MRYPLLCIFSLFTFYGIAQPADIDHLKAKLSTVNSDTALVNLYFQIGDGYRYFNYDSALHYALLSRESIKDKNPAAEARADGLAGNALRYKGNFIMAIDFHLKGLKLAEKHKLSEEMFRNLQGISTVYKDMRDYNQALEYAHRARQYADYVPDGKMVVAANLGDIHQRNNTPDSAIYYESAAYAFSLTMGNDYTKSFTLETLGEIQARIGNTELAKQYIKLSIIHAKAANARREMVEANNSLANIFMKNQQYDSAYIFAREAFQTADASSYKLGKVYAMRTLFQYFESKSRPDSAMFYLKMALHTRDELLDEEKLRDIQNMQFNEKIRIQENEKAIAEAKKERRFYIQIFAIAIFIALFITIVLALNRGKVKPSVIEFLSIVSLLLIFEFINLLLHPIVGSFTHHNPIWMLLILVGVAAFLVPLHHKAEHWLKSKITKRM